MFHALETTLLSSYWILCTGSEHFVDDERSLTGWR
jgi:hypothetical protein